MNRQQGYVVYRLLSYCIMRVTLETVQNGETAGQGPVFKPANRKSQRQWLHCRNPRSPCPPWHSSTSLVPSELMFGNSWRMFTRWQVTTSRLGSFSSN